VRHIGGRRRLLLLLLLVMLVPGVAGFFGARMLDQGERSASAPVAVGSPGGFVLPTTSPRAIPLPSPRLTPAPSTRATSAPRPTVAPLAPLAPPAPPAPAAITAAAHPAEMNPGQTIATWYRYVAEGAFDSAYALWSARMRGDYPRQPNLDGRWDDSAAVTFNQLYVAEQTASTVKVQVDFIETKDSGATRRFVGWWDLVLVDGRWLLDHPNF
jgi:hypothetical protein